MKTFYVVLQASCLLSGVLAAPAEAVPADMPMPTATADPNDLDMPLPIPLSTWVPTAQLLPTDAPAPPATMLPNAKVITPISGVADVSVSEDEPLLDADSGAVLVLGDPVTNPRKRDTSLTVALDTGNIDISGQLSALNSLVQTAIDTVNTIRESLYENCQSSCWLLT
jgi:hypothetical protein